MPSSTGLKFGKSTVYTETHKHSRALRSYLETLEDLRHGRMDILQRVRRLVDTDDVKPRIMREASAFESWVEVKPSMFEATIEQEMGKYEVFKESLETNASKQSELLETIQVRWVAFKFKLNFLTYSYIDLLSVVYKLAPRG